MRALSTNICALLLGAACAACGDDNVVTPDPDPDPDPDPQPEVAKRFTLRVENIAPWNMVKVSSQRTKTTRIEGNLVAGDVYEARFTAAAGHKLSFAMMLLESSDWFIAPDPAGLPLFENGVPLSGDITNRFQLWDAGTELDEEPGVGPSTGTKQATRDAGEPDPDTTIRPVPATMMLGSTTFTRPELAAMVRITITPPASASDPYFLLRVENVSTPSTLVTSQGSRSVTLSPFVWATHRGGPVFFEAGAPVRDNGFVWLAEAGQVDPLIDVVRYDRGIASPFARGIYVVHRDDAPLFALDQADRGAGLERLVEDGDPTTLQASLGGTSGLLDTDGMLQAGSAFEVTFDAEPGDRLSFATAMAASNDWFFAPGVNGIELFSGDHPRWGDITPELRLYDLGTESDEELDVGANVGTQQLAPNSGNADSKAFVRAVALPVYQTPASYHVRATLSAAAIE